MSDTEYKLTDEQMRHCFTCTNTSEPLAEGWPGLERYGRVVEAATAAKYAERIAELEAWKAKIIKESEEAYGESAMRYKFSLTKSGKCMNTFPKSIDGRWFALTPAENDGHIGHIARIADLQAKLDAAAAVDARLPEELAMMIRMLVSSLKRHSGYTAHEGSLPRRAMDLLVKHGLQGSVLRAPAEAIDALRTGDPT